MKKDIPFNKVLEQQAKDDVTLKKGDRTRLRLMVATAKLLQDTFFHDLRITDICKQSGVSQGTFYLYFNDKMSVTTTTLSQFVHHIFQSLKEAGTNQNSLSDAVYATTLSYVKQFYLNRGLLRCLMQMTEESTEFEKIYQSLNSTWNKRTASAIARRLGNRPADDPEGVMIVYAAGGMVDEYLANLYVRKDPTLTKYSGAPEDVAHLLSNLWMRVVIGDNIRLTEKNR
tara:strand:- start:10 stop:693 length:684 start_codon:yes stop_codon:yes gene_type:complete